jgi:hypothetical protein
MIMTSTKLKIITPVGKKGAPTIKQVPFVEQYICSKYSKKVIVLPCLGGECGLSKLDEDQIRKSAEKLKGIVSDSSVAIWTSPHAKKGAELLSGILNIQTIKEKLILERCRSDKICDILKNEIKRGKHDVFIFVTHRKDSVDFSGLLGDKKFLKDGEYFFQTHVASRNTSDEKTKRIRGPNLSTLVPRYNGVSVEDALRIADEAGAVIASNNRLHRALTNRKELSAIGWGLPCWSGTLVGYEKPDQELGEVIEFIDDLIDTRYIFPVPQEYVGSKNIALVVEHPHFQLVKDGKDRIVQADDVNIISRFPVEYHWEGYSDSRYCLPVFRGSGDDIWSQRLDTAVVLAARDDYSNIRAVYLNDYPSERFGVIVESPAADS